MTAKEKRDAINKLTAYIHCLKCQRSGKVCNDNCPTQYEAGNCGEIIKNLEFLLEEVKNMPILSKSAFNSLAFYEPLELCEDTISREAMLKTQAKYADQMGATKFWQMRDDIRALPPVQPTRKKGHWIPVKEEEKWLYMGLAYKCSNCDSAVDDDTDYCPDCGAEMESEE